MWERAAQHMATAARIDGPDAGARRDAAAVLMSAIVQETTRVDQAKGVQPKYRSREELEIREAVDRWGRSRWPDARLVHELVMGRGTARADMAFISVTHFVAVEIKSSLDSVDRLLHQIAVFRLAAPELWIVADERHLQDCRLIRYLLPSVGLAVSRRAALGATEFSIDVWVEAQRFEPEQSCLLSVLWVDELRSESERHRFVAGQRDTHAALVKRLSSLTAAEQMAAVCRQLRARNAMWRADPAVAAPR